MRLIDADSLLQVIRKNIPKNSHDEYQEGQEIGLSMAVEMVCNEPTVDAEPIRHGHWIVIGKRTDCEHILIFKCSCCHTPFIGEVDRYHYCPNCGAKIDEIEEGEVVVTKKGIIINMDEVEE